MATLAVVATLSVIALREGAAPTPQPAPPAEAVAVPDLPQADWVVRSYPAGVGVKHNRAIRRRVNNAQRGIAAALDDLYAATFLEPERLAESTKAHMAPPAARRFRNASIAIPGAEDVQFKRRRIRMGVEGRNARRAVATTNLVVAGHMDGERFRVRHQATLWLERSKGSWKVIGFHVAQRPRR